mgnify:CR=1 FL=1
MKIAILNDTHCGIRNSSEIFLDNAEDFYTNIFFPECDKRNVKQILHLGDYYDHRKFVNFKALNDNRKVFLEPMRDLGITMDIIPGNHDVYYKNTNQLCSLKELLGYFTSNVNILMEPTVLDYDGLKIGCLPWINAENSERYLNWLQNVKCDWIGAHLELSGFDMMRGIKSPHGMSSDLFKRFEVVMSGHFHTKSSKDNIYYLGSQMEFTWADAGDPKHFHIIDTETRVLTPVRNPLTMFTKIFYDDTKGIPQINKQSLEDHFVKVVVVNKTDPFKFDKFIDAIQQTKVHELKIAETFDEFIGANVLDDNISVEDTTELLDSYIEAVETDLDKDRMKTTMRSLYVEAQDKEIL